MADARCKKKCRPWGGIFLEWWGGRNLPVFALASAKPLAWRRAVLAETPGSSRVPRVRFPQAANTKQKSHPKGVAFLFGGAAAIENTM